MFKSCWSNGFYISHASALVWEPFKGRVSVGTCSMVGWGATSVARLACGPVCDEVWCAPWNNLQGWMVSQHSPSDEASHSLDEASHSHPGWWVENEPVRKSTQPACWASGLLHECCCLGWWPERLRQVFFKTTMMWHRVIMTFSSFIWNFVPSVS